MKVFMDTVGCRLNQAEIDRMAGQFRAAGHEIVGASEAADLAVVNTCAVTAQAASDSRAAIRRIARDGRTKVIVTGCWATLEPAAAESMPQVERVVANAEKDRLVTSVLNLPEFDFELEPLARRPLPGMRRRTRAFIKVQDGCDNHCTFCITAIARGSGRSRQIAGVLSDIRSALAGGAQEIVLTGVHLASWGQDLGSQLRYLVRAVLEQTEVPRLRLSSLEPWDLDAAFFELWDDPRLCRHLHLPLQSGCAATLRRMARKVSPESFRMLLTAARQAMPDVAITTDLIAGFPGETEAEFQESLKFVQETEFAGGHAFTYSARPGTAASRLTNQLPVQLRQARNSSYRSLFEEQSRVYRERFIGRTAAVLWESVARAECDDWRLEGHTGNYIRVTASAPEPRWNVIDHVEMTGLSSKGMNGVIRNSG